MVLHAVSNFRQFLSNIDSPDQYSRAAGGQLDQNHFYLRVPLKYCTSFQTTNAITPPLVQPYLVKIALYLKLAKNGAKPQIRSDLFEGFFCIFWNHHAAQFHTIYTTWNQQFDSLDLVQGGN